MQDIGFDYRHTRYPLDQDGVLSESLGIPVSSCFLNGLDLRGVMQVYL